MIDEMKPICLHFHIFKNAGTTIDSILEKNFSSNAVRIDAEKPSAIVPMNSVLDFLNKNPEIKSFSSHQLRFPIPNNTKFNFIPMLFIRHPIDRIFSIYSYNRRRNDQRTQTIRQARINTLEEYIQSFLEMKKNMVMKNFQVMFLSKNETDSEVTDLDYNIAVQCMRGTKILGVVDRLDESLVVAEEFLKKYFPYIDLSYSPKNISEERTGTLNEKLDEGKKQLGEHLCTKLLAKNEYDLQLYSIANDELNIRIKKINSFNEKLENFKARISKNFSETIQNSQMLKSRRIWYSPEDKSFYFKRTKNGTKIGFEEHQERVLERKLKAEKTIKESEKRRADVRSKRDELILKKKEKAKKEFEKFIGNSKRELDDEFRNFERMIKEKLQNSKKNTLNQIFQDP